MKLGEFGRLSQDELQELCADKFRVFNGKVGDVMNLGAHEYNTVKGTFKYSGRVLRVDKDGVFSLNGKLIDIARIPKKPGRVYLVSAVCAVYAKRDDFVFVINGMQRGKSRYLFSFF